MPEETVWRGSSSQLKNFGVYFLWGLACVLIIGASFLGSQVANGTAGKSGAYILLLLIVPIFIALARYLQTKCKVYELTTERLKITEGALSKITDTLELYRVKDIETRQPFRYRIFGIENVQLNTSDASSPFILLEAIPCRVGLADKVRNQVEIIRQQKGVREIDVE